jgi:hypothetical protein
MILLSTATVPHPAFLPDAVMPYHLFDGSLSQHFLHEQYAVAVKTSACKLFTETMLNRDITINTIKDNTAFRISEKTLFLLIFISFHLSDLSVHHYGIKTKNITITSTLSTSSLFELRQYYA